MSSLLNCIMPLRYLKNPVAQNRLPPMGHKDVMPTIPLRRTKAILARFHVTPHQFPWRPCPRLLRPSSWRLRPNNPWSLTPKKVSIGLINVLERIIIRAYTIKTSLHESITAWELRPYSSCTDLPAAQTINNLWLVSGELLSLNLEPMTQADPTHLLSSTTSLKTYTNLHECRSN